MAGKQSRDIPIPEDAQYVRLQVSSKTLDKLAVLAAHRRVSVAAITRIIVTMLAEGKTVTQDSVLAEIDAIRAQQQEPPVPPTPSPPKRKPGRPRKKESDL